ncbi:MAG: hypothetical protein F4Z72_03280 [Gemmatimonadales bacterium]|nr:hypothetical protein [Candidatus Palauibacter irciniicola]MYC19133.1 hypothetical protein [Gemmatimonadales bacterium]
MTSIVSACVPALANSLTRLRSSPRTAAASPLPIAGGAAAGGAGGGAAAGAGSATAGAARFGASAAARRRLTWSGYFAWNCRGDSLATEASILEAPANNSAFETPGSFFSSSSMNSITFSFIMPPRVERCAGR